MTHCEHQAKEQFISCLIRLSKVESEERINQWLQRGRSSARARMLACGQKPGQHEALGRPFCSACWGPNWQGRESSSSSRRPKWSQDTGTSAAQVTKWSKSGVKMVIVVVLREGVKMVKKWWKNGLTGGHVFFVSAKIVILSTKKCKNCNFVC